MPISMIEIRFIKFRYISTSRVYLEIKVESTGGSLSVPRLHRVYAQMFSDADSESRVRPNHAPQVQVAFKVPAEVPLGFPGLRILGNPRLRSPVSGRGRRAHWQTPDGNRRRGSFPVPANRGRGRARRGERPGFWPGELPGPRTRSLIGGLRVGHWHSPGSQGHESQWDSPVQWDCPTALASTRRL
jgi:hypothetical protein